MTSSIDSSRSSKRWLLGSSLTTVGRVNTVDVVKPSSIASHSCWALGSGSWKPPSGSAVSSRPSPQSGANFRIEGPPQPRFRLGNGPANLPSPDKKACSPSLRIDGTRRRYIHYEWIERRQEKLNRSAKRKASWLPLAIWVQHLWHGPLLTLCGGTIQYSKVECLSRIR